VKATLPVELITALYRTLLGREPDKAGLEHLLRVADNISIENLVNTFLSSNEYLVKSKMDLVHKTYAQNPFSKNIAPYHILDLDQEFVGDLDSTYMTTLNCVSSDFLAPIFKEFCKSIGKPWMLHRKLWEFAFVAHHLKQRNTLRADAHGVGFGVGTEPLPALFASIGCKVLATDAPEDLADRGWSLTNQHSATRESLFKEHIVLRGAFDANVSFAPVDMNDIEHNISNYDFCWSCCSLEHLGTIEKGIEFVEYTVENVLKPGGVACHTSELNLTSNKETIESGGTVLFRLQDIQRLAERLRKRGHECDLLPFNFGASYIDHLVDVPGFGGDIHLKLQLGGFVTTSFGIVAVRRA
jgi:hypothetical protein